jgi:tetratricopeptide (TPR) repeat protein
MSREDWYRRETWTQDDQDAFWKRLHRSREPFHRAQYLRIQAVFLERAGILDPAVLLLEKALLEESDGAETAQIHHQIVSCREKQRRFSDAFDHLRLALAAEARWPNWQTGAALTFGRIAVDNGVLSLYDEVLAVLTAYAERKPPSSSWHQQGTFTPQFLPWFTNTWGTRLKRETSRAPRCRQQPRRGHGFGITLISAWLLTSTRDFTRWWRALLIPANAGAAD